MRVTAPALDPPISPQSPQRPILAAPHQVNNLTMPAPVAELAALAPVAEPGRTSRELARPGLLTFHDVYLGL